ncbi:MAG: hypothetical protein ACRCUA_04835 [Fusobacteriaceae bacterium]
MKRILLLSLGLILSFNILFANESTATIKMTAYVEDIAIVKTKEISKDKIVFSLNTINDSFGKITRNLENSKNITGEDFVLNFKNSEDDIQFITVINS